MLKKTLLGASGGKLQKWAFTIGSSAALAASADAAVVADFTFESSLSAGGSTTAASVGNLLAEVGLGTASGVHVAATSVYSSPAGFASAHSFSANTWGIGDYYQFQVNTTGYAGLVLSFDMARSSTGPAQFDLSYSTDGVNWVGYSTSATADISLGSGAFSTGATTPGVSFSFDLSTITALDNIGSAYFRISNLGVNSSGGAVASTGTSRIDNVMVSTVPEPSTVAMISIAGAAALTLRRRTRKH